MNRIAKFNIGDVVLHKRIRYRAVVIDVDPLFQASGNFNPRAEKEAFATRNPWYRLLVDDSSQMTYVEECMLIADPAKQPIDNPNVHDYLSEQKGVYRPTAARH